MLTIRKLSSLVLILTLSSQALAECDFSTGITKTQSGYVYSEECNRQVGKLVLDNKDKDSAIEYLNKTVTAKDLGLKIQEDRADKWMNTSLKLEDRVNEIDKVSSSNKELYFGLGVLTTVLAVFAASKIRR